MFKVNDKESFSILSVEEFCAITVNPRQRDTESHAKKAQKKHLKVLMDIHKYVEVALLPSGDLIKLDGHTRAYLWQIGKLERPPFVVAKIRLAKNSKEVTSMYNEYDNGDSVETNQHKVQGAFRQSEVVFQSRFLRGGKYLTALCLAKHGRIDGSANEGDGIYNLIAYFQSDLAALDTLKPSASKFTGGIFAAALITIRKYGDSALQFWDLYNRDMGNKDGREKDAVQMLTDLLVMRRTAGTLASRGHVVDVCGRAIATFEKWRKGEKYSGGIKGVDVSAYIRAIKEKSKSKAMFSGKLFAGNGEEL